MNRTKSKSALTTLCLTTLLWMTASASYGGDEWGWSLSSQLVTKSGKGLQAVARNESTITAAWVTKSGDLFVVKSSDYVNKEWDTEQIVSDPGKIIDLKLSTAHDDAVDATWVVANNDNPNKKIFYSNRSSLGWSKPEEVATVNGEISHLRMIENQEDITFIVWVETREVDSASVSHKIKIINRENYRWSVPLTIDEIVTRKSSEGFGDLMIESTKPTLLAWYVFNSTNRLLKASFYTGESWSEPINVGVSIYNPYSPYGALTERSLAANQLTDGEVILIWGDQYSKYNGRNWSVPQVIREVPSNGSGPAPRWLLRNDKGGVTALYGSSQYSCDRGCYGYSSSESYDFIENRWIKSGEFGRVLSATSGQSGVINTFEIWENYYRVGGNTWSSTTLCSGRQYADSHWTISQLDVDKNGPYNNPSPTRFNLPSVNCGSGAVVSYLHDSAVNLFKLQTNPDGLSEIRSRVGSYENKNLSVEVLGEGSVIGDGGFSCRKECIGKIQENSNVNLIPQGNPEAGYGFSAWSGDCLGAVECKLLMNSDRKVSAIFSVLPKYTLRVLNGGKGYISTSDGKINRCQLPRCIEKYYKGSVVELEASPSTGYFLKGWKGCTEVRDSKCVVNITKPLAVVKPLYSLMPKHVLTIVKTKMGSVISDPSGLNCRSQARKCDAGFITGTDVTLKLIPLTGHTYVGWSGACSGVTYDTCTVKMDGPKTVGVEFQ